MHICVYVCVHVFTCVCIYVCVHIFIYAAVLPLSIRTQAGNQTVHGREGAQPSDEQSGLLIMSPSREGGVRGEGAGARGL